MCRLFALLLNLLFCILQLKVNEYTSRGNNCHFHFCLTFQSGSTPMEKTLLPKEQILSRIDPI